MSSNQEERRASQSEAPPAQAVGSARPEDAAAPAGDGTTARRTDRLDFSILQDGAQRTQPCQTFEIDKSEERNANTMAYMRQSVDSQVSQGNQLNSNTFLFKNFSKLTQRSQDGGSSANWRTPLQRNSTSHSVRPSLACGARSTVGNKPIGARGSLAPRDLNGANCRGSYQKHLEDRVRFSSSASRQSLHMVQQAWHLNNEANMERFCTAQEISQEIISGRVSSKRHTVDPRMMNGGLESNTSCFNFGQSKRIPFNPNSIGLNQLKEQMHGQQQASPEKDKERKTLQNMLSEVHQQNRPAFSPTEEAGLLQGVQNDYERLLSKNGLDSFANDEETCLEGGARSAVSAVNLLGASANGKAAIDNIDHIFPQTTSVNHPMSLKSTAKSRASLDHYENVDMPRIRSASCCSYVYDLVACLLWPIGWLLYHMFCCFLCNKKKRMFTVPPHMLQKHLKKRKYSEDTKTMNAMIQLLKNTPKAISLLDTIRINPQLNKMVKKRVVGKKHSIKLRSDLEFYIPQLVSHFLRADLKSSEVEEMKEFFLRASQVNIFFAHRVWFNLRASLINKDNQLHVKRILNLLSELEVKLFSSTQEKLYIANSDSLLKLISKTNLESLLDQDCLHACHEEEHMFRNKGKGTNYLMGLFVNKNSGHRDYAKAQHREMNSLDRYNSMDNKHESEAMEGLLRSNHNLHYKDDDHGDPEAQVLHVNKNKHFLNIDGILSIFNFQLGPYKKQISHRAVQFNHNESFITAPSQQSHLQQYFQRSFMSTPSFISDLTDISVRILKSDNKEKFLSDNLQKMNKSLPATTYTPILSNFQRNYMVLNIAHQESRLFITAEKAPFLICIEVFQPQELELYIQQLHAQEKPRAYEILNKLNLINKDQNKLVQKINYELSKPQYINSQQQAANQSKKKIKKQSDLDDLNGFLYQSDLQQNFNSHEGVVNVGPGLHKYPSLDEGQEAELKDRIEDRKSVNYQSFMNEMWEQESAGALKKRLPAVEMLEKSDSLIEVDTSQLVLDEQREHLQPVEEASSEFGTARGWSAAQGNSEYSRPGNALNLERGSINEHYGFYQNQEKVITPERPERPPSTEDFTMHSFSTAQPRAKDLDEEGDVINYLEYDKMQRSTVMSYYDQDIMHEGHRPSDQEDEVHKMGQRTNPQRHTYHPHQAPRQGGTTTIQNDHDQYLHEQNSFVEHETQGQGQGQQVSVREGSFVSASGVDEPREESEFTQAIPEFQSLEEKDIDKYFQELNEKIFTGEPLAKQEERVRQSSAYGHFKTWKMLKVIVKSGDDLRSEQFAMQLIETIDLIFKKRKLKLKLQPYDILSTGVNCGIVEFISDAMSIDYIKKKMLEKTGRDMDLVDFYRIRFGNVKSQAYKNAINNLVDSLAAYSLVCYILQIKDRHNANILINQNDGSLVHIDFGFILASRLLNFETAPFKITGDIIRLLGGLEGKGFKRFRERMVEGYMALHEDNEKVLVLVKMLAQSQSDLPCFKRGAEQAIAELCQRLTPLGPNVRLDKAQCTYEVDKIIGDAYRTWSTYVYDQYQYCCQGIL